MTVPAPLTTLLPIRDERERTLGYELRTHPGSPHAANDIDAEARAVLGLLQGRELLRFARPRPLHVPITPGVLRGGGITGFASADVVFTLAVDVLDDAEGRRALERFAATGFRFAFVLRDLDVTYTLSLPAPLQGSWVACDVSAHGAGLAVANTVQRVLEAGARPIARHVDDRATRERLRASGVGAFTGRTLPRGRAASDPARDRALAALTLLTRLADGRPVDASTEAFIAGDAELSRSVLRAAAAAAPGQPRPRTMAQAIMRLGREALADRLMLGTAFLLAESAGDPEVAAIAIRRGRMLERLGAALDRTGHPRARMVAGLLSIADVATGLPSVVLADRLALAPAMRDLLVERGAPLGGLLDVVEAHEAGWWDDLFARAERLGLAPTVVNDAWRDGWREARSELAARAAADA
jgi:c-di-GMP-related signal transduction protein